MFVASFARFRAPIASFSEERTSSPFGSRDLVAMVKTRGGCEKRYGVPAVMKNPSPNRGGRQPLHRMPRATGPICAGEENYQTRDRGD